MTVRPFFEKMPAFPTSVLAAAPRGRGNCYVTCEALYHLLGGKKAGWRAFTLKHEGDTHWYLEKWTYADKTFVQYGAPFVMRVVKKGMPFHLEVRLDPTVSQFKTPPDYSKGRARGFLTKKPSKRAKALMEQLVWQR